MARNAEKANVQAKKDAVAAPVERRPWRASEVTEVALCEKWRNQVLREIGKGVADIQNASMGEHALRELNDNINKLLREKKHWETQIKALGGPDYHKSAPRMTDADGRGALGSGGYFYFGAAKDLPGVRELFESQTAEQTKRQRGELYKQIDADYYGYRDDDDGLLEKLEKKQQEKLVAASLAEWQKSRSQRAAESDAAGDAAMDSSEGAADESAVGGAQHRSHVELPSQEEIEKLILAKKKAEILAKFQ